MNILELLHSVLLVARRGLVLLLHFVGLLGAADPLQAAPVPQEAAAARAPEPRPGPYLFEPGASTPAVFVPRAERLTYKAYVDLALISTHVGVITQTCSVTEDSSPVVVLQPKKGGEVASISLHAEGGALGYELVSTIETRVQPAEWPRIVYQVKNSGKEQRRREILMGKRDGVPTSSYRGDTRKGAPDGIRIWKEAELRTVPEGTVDMLSAVLLARTLVREERETLRFPLVDKTRVWQLTLSRGEERRIDTPAGSFAVVEVVLDAGPYPGEEIDTEKLEQFQGVFGIQGSIHLWVDKKTGVAVRIQGDLPVSDLLTLGIDVILDSYSGTPAEFVPLPPEKKK